MTAETIRMMHGGPSFTRHWVLDGSTRAPGTKWASPHFKKQAVGGGGDVVVDVWCRVMRLSLVKGAGVLPCWPARSQVQLFAKSQLKISFLWAVPVRDPFFMVNIESNRCCDNGTFILDKESFYILWWWEIKPCDTEEKKGNKESARMACKSRHHWKAL